MVHRDWVPVSYFVIRLITFPLFISIGRRRSSSSKPRFGRQASCSLTNLIYRIPEYWIRNWRYEARKPQKRKSKKMRIRRPGGEERDEEKKREREKRTFSRRRTNWYLRLLSKAKLGECSGRGGRLWGQEKKKKRKRARWVFQVLLPSFSYVAA